MHLTCASVASFVALTLTLASAGTPTAWAQKGPATTPQEGKRLVPDMAPSAKAEAQAQALQAQKRAAKYSFEFSKAEIQDVVKAISDLTGHNFIIPERIKGQRLTITATVQNPLAPGRHFIHCGLQSPFGISVYVARAASFVVFGAKPAYGLITPEYEYEVEIEGEERS